MTIQGEITDLSDIQPVVMPHSRAAEEGLLGALLIDPSVTRKIALEPEDFYIARNGMIYRAIQELLREKRDVDYLTVCTYLDSKKQLTEIGGAAYVGQMISATPSSLHADSYAAVIKERARRREIIYATQKLTTAAFNMGSDLQEAVSGTMDTLARSVTSEKGAVHISQFVSQIYDEVDAATKNPKDIYGISTGLYDWDKVSYGLQKGEKLLLSGEPGVGKSVLAAQVLCYAASPVDNNGKPKDQTAGALYELEMSGRQVVRRALASASHRLKANITTQKMRQGKLTEEEIPIFTQAVEAMSDLPIYISDASQMTTAEIRADLMRLKEFFGVELVIIDYEALLGDCPEKDANTRSTLISERTHAIAKDLNLAMISISDMTKEGIKGSQKGQGAVAGTARALHDADQTVVIRKDPDDPNKVRMTWEKMREGEGDRFVDLVRIQGFPMFENYQTPASRI